MLVKIDVIVSEFSCLKMRNKKYTLVLGETFVCFAMVISLW